MYTLYYAPGAASIAVHVTLHEIGAEFVAKSVNLTAGEQRQSDFLALNPAGTVPVLVIDGTPHTETAALCLLLAERHPEAGLLPPAHHRPEMLQWLFYAANIIQPMQQVFFYPDRYAPPGSEAGAKEMAAQRIMAAWQRLEARYSAGSTPYLFGDSPCAADIFLGLMARWGRMLPTPPTAGPGVERMARALTSRPAWIRTQAAEQHAPWVF